MMRTCLPPGPRAAGDARALVAETLWGSCGPDTIDVAQLLVSELVGNAVRHAVGPVRLDVARDAHQVTVAVADGSYQLPRQPNPAACTDELAEGGRGIYLVGELSRDWGARPADPGKVVWFRLDL